MKRTFKYCATHKEDEKYMQEMCAKGWAATKLVEGFWTFEPCKPNQYFYRICYVRKMSRDEIKNTIQRYENQGIEFVSHYSFWIIVRSTKPFELYTKLEEKKLCQEIYAPMPMGAIVSWILCLICLYFSYTVNVWFLLLSFLITFYGAMCTWLAISYHSLLKKI